MARNVTKVTLVTLFSKKEDEKEGDEQQSKYVCNGGSQGCDSKKGIFKTNDKKLFKNHISRTHKSMAAELMATPLSIKFNKPEEDRDEEEMDWVYVCVGDEDGDCPTDYKGNDKANFQTHIYEKHTISVEKKEEIKQKLKLKWARQSFLKRGSLTVYNRLKKLDQTPLLEIESETSDDDETSPSYLELDPLYEELDSSGQEKHATVFVVYFVPGKIDHGPLETYQMERYTADFPFSIYFATSSNPTRDKSKKVQSRLVKLIDRGAVCHRMDFKFNRGSTNKNRKAAFKWQQYWKYVHQISKRVKKDPNTINVKILNQGLRRKSAYKKKRTLENYRKARRFATQNRDFLPLPLHLLQVDKLPKFTKYTLKD